MSPDFYFALTLFVRMAVTAAFLIAATVTAERAGPLIGGLVATLPISAGPIYIFLAIDHGAHFVGQSALGSMITNAFNIAFAVVYCLLAQKRSLVVSLVGAFALWAVLTWIVNQVHPGLWGAIAINVVALAGGLWLVSSLRHVQFPRMRTYWYDYVLRATMVAVLVGIVVTLSHHIGATASGNLAVFPIVLTSIIIILHPRVGGPATAAVMSNAVVGLGGFAVAMLVLHLVADALGSVWSLLLTLAISVGFNLLIFYAQRRMKTA
ncbi:hypothetical protein [Undibacter mobilis]|uniref:Uncharacterized protein n=1 Tax=Undibacter mobilis TaxID=2292256 RepID=A0A371B926_9BRAD|nr:hypothetical protein [Undibacter mobilis]RDV03881.1 hypothetical protein DXH78_04335 [Undibacter mobilis]